MVVRRFYLGRWALSVRKSSRMLPVIRLAKWNAGSFAIAGVFVTFMQRRHCCGEAA